MPVFVKDDLRVLFVHVPKTGGSSIERTFVDSGWAMHFHDAVTGPGTINRLRTCTPQHMHADLLRQTFHVQDFDLVFHVVREPLARFRSEYAMKNQRDLRTDARAVDAWAGRVLGRFERNRFALDNHLRPQHEFVLEQAVQFRFEDGIDEVYRRLSEDHGLPVSGGTRRLKDREARSGVRSSDVALSPALVERLRELYALDFERLGY